MHHEENDDKFREDDYIMHHDGEVEFDAPAFWALLVSLVCAAGIVALLWFSQSAPHKEVPEAPVSHDQSAGVNVA